MDPRDQVVRAPLLPANTMPRTRFLVADRCAALTQRTSDANASRALFYKLLKRCTSEGVRRYLPIRPASAPRDQVNSGPSEASNLVRASHR